MIVEFNENQIKNLFLFLDRVQVKGLHEIHAMMDIMNTLSPVEEMEEE